MKIAVLAESGKHYLPSARVRILAALLMELTRVSQSLRIFWAGRQPAVAGWADLKQIRHADPLLFDRSNSIKRWQNGQQVKRLIQAFGPDIVLVVNEHLVNEINSKQVIWVHDETEWLSVFSGNEKLSKRWQNVSGLIFSQINQAEKWRRLIPKLAPAIYATGSFYLAAFRPSDWMTRVSWKTRNTRDNDYFLFYGSGHTDEVIMPLLKAFSRFKKRQQSSLQLVICLRGLSGGSWREKLKTFKYRQEVLVESPRFADLPEWLGSAYCVVSPAADAKDWWLLATAQSFVPIITERNETVEEVLGKEVPYFADWNEEDLAEQLIAVYTQETTRNKKTETAQKVVGEATVEEAAKNLKTILKNIKNKKI